MENLRSFCSEFPEDSFWKSAIISKLEEHEEKYCLNHKIQAKLPSKIRHMQEQDEYGGGVEHLDVRTKSWTE